MKPELKNRIIFGILLLLVVAFSILVPANWLFGGLVWLAALLMGFEYLNLTRKMEAFLFPWMIYGLVCLFFGSFFAYVSFESLVQLYFWLLVLWLGIALVSLSMKNRPFARTLGFYAYFQIWVILPCMLVYGIKLAHNGEKMLGFLILLVVASDTFSYFGGKALGQHKLAPRISPGKTIEGSLCGLLGAWLFGNLFLSYFPLFSFPFSWVVIFCITLAAQAGDLLESWMKRRAGVKDSSSIIPGHGGLLDRTDAFLLAIPSYALILLSAGLLYPIGWGTLWAALF